MTQPIYLATKTLEAINNAIVSDQGAAFRGYSKLTLPTMDDAYSTDEFPFRSHMGASMIGKECAREVWYGFHWALINKHESQLLRLFNRGHLEEARFIAMLLIIGVQVWQSDNDGNQFRIHDANGHFGGSGDGVARGLPDLAADQTVLLEFKTSAEKKFKEMQKKGVSIAKWEHFVQMQTYMNKMNLGVALYMMVNKNTDELYAELVYYDDIVAQEYLNRGRTLVYMDVPPIKISESAGRIPCRWCDYKGICHLGEPVEINCRTCSKSIKSTTDKNWICGETGQILEKEQQLAGCFNHEPRF